MKVNLEVIKRIVISNGSEYCRICTFSGKKSVISMSNVRFDGKESSSTPNVVVFDTLCEEGHSTYNYVHYSDYEKHLCELKKDLLKEGADED